MVVVSRGPLWYARSMVGLLTRNFCPPTKLFCINSLYGIALVPCDHREVVSYAGTPGGSKECHDTAKTKSVDRIPITMLRFRMAGEDPRSATSRGDIVGDLFSFVSASEPVRPKMGEALWSDNFTDEADRWKAAMLSRTPDVLLSN